MAVEIRRVYDQDPGDGVPRVLVDRLWPRGVAKRSAPVDEWLKDVAPSSELRTWYGHDPAKFDEFARRYKAELRTKPAADGVASLRARAVAGPLALMTATRDVEHSGAHVLRDVVARRNRRSQGGGGRSQGGSKARRT